MTVGRQADGARAWPQTGVSIMRMTTRSKVLDLSAPHAGGRRPDRLGLSGRVWRKVKSDWEAWNAPSLGRSCGSFSTATVVRVRLDRKATSISLLVVIGVCSDGQSTEAWRTVLDDLIKRGLQRPQFLIVDGTDWRTRSPASGTVCRPRRHHCVFAKFYRVAPLSQGPTA
jgi:hypothetical protein